MNDFTLMIIFSAVLLAVAVAVHLWAQAKRVGIYAPEAEAEAIFWCKFDRMEGGMLDMARFRTREELDSFMANTVHRVTEYGPRVAGLTIDNVASATFVIDRHAIKCISDVWVCNEGYTWLSLRDELIFSVVYEDSDVCHCKVVPNFEWLALDYIDEGVIPPSMVEVANA